MDSAAIISFLVASICLTLAPGPDILFVLAKSICSGAKSGICVAVGLITGTFIHTMLAAFGISLLIRESAVAFPVVKWSGVAYLTFLGISALRHLNDLPGSDEANASPEKASRNLYMTGVCMAVLNPKLIIFFLALFPQFVPENAENPSLCMLFLGFGFSAQALIIFLAVAFFAGSLGNILNKRPAIAKAMNMLTALVLFGIAASVAFV